MAEDVYFETPLDEINGMALEHLQTLALCA
jgi:hypothetical protein